MTGSPEETDPAAPEKASFPADERRDRHDMIRIRGVLQTKKEAQTQNCNERRFHFDCNVLSSTGLSAASTLFFGVLRYPRIRSFSTLLTTIS